MLPRRSWLGVCVALYVHVWRSHRKIVDKLEGASYEELAAPLLDATRYTLQATPAAERKINAMATPPSWSGKTAVLVHDARFCPYNRRRKGVLHFGAIFAEVEDSAPAAHSPALGVM
ncbi:unnamed protein product [Symbiodinium sp. CCMP2592]|nr:unnamed protein product [Symbiodinium sp. CCMP2592]